MLLDFAPDASASARILGLRVQIQVAAVAVAQLALPGERPAVGREAEERLAAADTQHLADQIAGSAM
jgi:hypothetical protein